MTTIETIYVTWVGMFSLLAIVVGLLFYFAERSQKRHPRTHS